jgi:hypothetical protein
VDELAAALPTGATIMLGDLHGTREIPAFVGRALASISARGPAVLALEMWRDQLALVDGYLAGTATRAQLIAGTAWTQPYQDGRTSVAAVALLDEVRRLRATGRAISVVAIDEPGLEPEAREAAMANRVIAARREHPQATLLVYAGNLHTKKAAVKVKPGFAWMAMRVAAAGIEVTSYLPRWADGTAWVCTDNVAEHCGVTWIGGRAPSTPGAIHVEKSPTDDGWFGVGPITASTPAARPDLAARLDELIAAAAKSPLAIAVRARRAYDANDFTGCADLLATIAAPDSETVYDHACCLARAGRRDEALERLAVAVRAGFANREQAERDEDLASLRADPRWPF